jgi:hypothetical protein
MYMYTNIQMAVHLCMYAGDGSKHNELSIWDKKDSPLFGGIVTEWIQKGRNRRYYVLLDEQGRLRICTRTTRNYVDIIGAMRNLQVCITYK